MVPLKYLHNQRLWHSVLAAMLIPLALVAFWPTPVDRPIHGLLADVLDLMHHHGIPSWLNYNFVEASANVILFVPVGFVSRLSFPNKHWWQAAAFGLLASGCIELGQLIFLQERFASPTDILTNTSGAVIGALIAFVTVKRVEAHHLPAADLQYLSSDD